MALDSISETDWCVGFPIKLEREGSEITEGIDQNETKQNIPLTTTPKIEEQVVTTKHKVNRFTNEQKCILDEWFFSHINYAYPNYYDVTQLTYLTGLTQRQIQVYFTNKRNRSKAKSKSRSDSFYFSIPP